jgi:hypothetical protein
MVRRQTGNRQIYRQRQSRVSTGTLLVCFLLIPLLFCCKAALAADDIIEQSGIRYPDGYDVNTVGEVRGKVQNFVFPPKGPAHFTLISPKDTYTVFVSPSWYWSDYGVTLKDGTEIRVIGSKSLGKDGNLYIISQEIRFPDSARSLVFRSKDGSPLWKHFGSGSARGGIGSPSGSKGGMGAGRGMGRGR